VETVLSSPSARGHLQQGLLMASSICARAGVFKLVDHAFPVGKVTTFFVFVYVSDRIV
jgi:hypothetical protein